MSELPPLELTDPTQAPAYPDGPLSRWCRGALYDPRDEVFIRLTLKVTGLMLAAMAGLLSVAKLAPAWFWPAAIPYLSLWGWYSAPVILMLHNTMHRRFLQSPALLDKAHPFAMSFLFGIPTGYREHHLGMHHVEDNLLGDLSSTMRYRRDSFLHFLPYWGRNFFLGIVEIPLYLSRKKRHSMARRALFGELGHQAVIVGALLLDWRFGLVAFAIPWFTIRFLMMTGNWGQHAFLNPARKNDGISNAITCINSGYNQRAFNDGYHVGHHLKANRHWTELPKDFQDSRELYIREGAIVFEGLDFFLVSILLWTGQWGILAKRYVRLDGRERSDEDVIAMLKARVQPMQEWPAAEAAQPRLARAASA